MKNGKTILGALALVPALISCAAEPGDDGALDEDGARSGQLEDSAALAERASSLCLLPPTPPPPDLSWVLSATNTVEAELVDPDNGECDNYVVNARYVDDFQVTLVEPADTPEKCVGTNLYVRKYTKNDTSGAWSYLETETIGGVWTVNGCRHPKFDWYAHTTSDARVSITSKRTYSSGQFSVIQRGLPFVVRATDYYNPPPH